MSWSVVRKNVPGKISTYRELICDTIDDLATLPSVPALPAGCECYCSEDGNTYILETDGDWVVKGGSSDSGGDDTPTSDTGVFKAVFKYDSTSDETTTDCTFAEIQQASIDGKIIVGVLEYYTDDVVVSTVTTMNTASDSEEFWFDFYRSDIDTSDLTLHSTLILQRIVIDTEDIINVIDVTLVESSSEPSD